MSSLPSYESATAGTRSMCCSVTESSLAADRSQHEQADWASEFGPQELHQHRMEQHLRRHFEGAWAAGALPPAMMHDSWASEFHGPMGEGPGRPGFRAPVGGPQMMMPHPADMEAAWMAQHSVQFGRHPLPPPAAAEAAAHLQGAFPDQPSDSHAEAEVGCVCTVVRTLFASSS